MVTPSDRNARVRAAARTATGPVTWELERAAFGSSAMVAMLLNGWEPFAVEDTLVYFRRQTLAGLN